MARELRITLPLDPGHGGRNSTVPILLTLRLVYLVLQFIEGRFDMRRILPVLALSVLGVLASSDGSRAEITYPWCAQYSGGRGGGRNCGFWTYEQCMATVSGNGGFCEMNAMYSGPSPGQIPPPAGLRRRPG